MFCLRKKTKTEMRFDMFYPVIDIKLAHLFTYPRLSLPMQFDCRKKTVNQKRILKVNKSNVNLTTHMN